VKLHPRKLLGHFVNLQLWAGKKLFFYFCQENEPIEQIDVAANLEVMAQLDLFLMVRRNNTWHID
jgi:hypothetical protein